MIGASALLALLSALSLTRLRLDIDVLSMLPRGTPPFDFKALTPNLFQRTVSTRAPVLVSYGHRESRGNQVLERSKPDAQLVAIVDDDASVRQSTCRLIRSFGFHAEAFGSAEDFLASTHTSKTGCLILDVRMPEMDGLELQRRLVAAGLLIPIVFITGCASDEEKRRALRAGAVDFLPKPVAKDDLLRILRAVFEQSTSERGEDDDE